jgi:transposase
LVQTFAALLRERRASGLADWLGQAAQSGIPEFVGVARSLRQDLQAVQAAFDSRASNGQTEGRVTRIKLIKRQCYGRANFDLLRLRLLYRDTPDDAPP